MIKETPTPRAEYSTWPLSVRRCGALETIKLRFRCRKWFGFETHYFNDRTVACPGEGECLLCEAGQQKVWAGATVASRLNGTMCCLFMITQAVVLTLEENLEVETGLANQIWSFRRAKKNKRSELQCEFLGNAGMGMREWSHEAISLHVKRIFGASHLSMKDQLFFKEVKAGSDAGS